VGNVEQRNKAQLAEKYRGIAKQKKITQKSGATISDRKEYGDKERWMVHPFVKAKLGGMKIFVFRELIQDC